MMKPAVKKLKAVVFGASGATGREVVTELLESPKWETVTVVVRRTIDRWGMIPEDQKKKLDTVICDNFEQLFDLQKWQFTGYDTLFCCLGASSTKYGKNIEFPDVYWNSGKADTSYMICFTKNKSLKGVIAVGLPLTSIFRPGLLVNRDNDKLLVERILNWVPFLPKIEARDVGRAARIEAEIRHNPSLNETLDAKLKLKKLGKEGTIHYFYENWHMLDLLRIKS